MTRLAEIETHIAGISELLDIVGAMRSLASMRVQEAHRALPGIRRYAETMAAAIGSVLLLMPKASLATRATPGRRALVVCTAEHGFVGGFNGRVLDAAERLLDRDDSLFVLGSRGAASAQERRWTIAWAHPMATRPEGVPESLRPLTVQLYRLIAQSHITIVDVMFARHRPDGAATIERRRLLPLDLASLAANQPRLPPLCNLAPGVLLEKLVADYLFAALTEAAVESLASENAARFAAMGSAHDNVAKKLEELRQEARQARQSEITTELLDLVTGAEAMNRAGRHTLRSSRRGTASSIG
jgi:F-type H+-transporting ATPase subunit gamma